MQKIKKFVYPFIFTFCFFAFFIILAIVLNIALPSGDYAGLGIAFIILAVWIWLIFPIYCLKYSKVIKDEKLKYLFATYNSLVVTITCILPFISEKIIFYFGAILFVWMEIWNVCPLVLSSISRKKQADLITEELPTSTHPLLQNKTKRTLVICFTLFYLLTQIIDQEFIKFVFFQNFTYIFPLFATTLILIFCVLKTEKYWWQKWLLPVAFGINLFYNGGSLLSNLRYINYNIENPLYFMQLIISFLILVAIIFMFMGSFFNFKYINLLKYGALAGCVLRLISSTPLIITLPILNLHLLIQCLAYILFYVGIFILATNKENTDLV